MTEDEIRARFEALADVHVLVGSPETGTPELAYGDTFCTYVPTDGSPPPKLPFATIVTHDVPGWDKVSNLDRPGAFRVNLAVGRAGVPPVTDAIDYSREDMLLPHPQHAAQGWVSVVNPGPATAAEVIALIAQAHERARKRHRPADQEG